MEIDNHGEKTTRQTGIGKSFISTYTTIERILSM